MRFSTILVLTLSYFTVFVCATILTDISSISAFATTLDKPLNAFPNSGGSLAQVLVIHNNGVSLTSAFQSGTTDVVATPGPLSAADASAIDASITTLVPILLDISNAYLVKETAFAAVSPSVVALIKQDIINIRAAILAFFNALIAITPLPYQTDLINARNALDTSFSATISAY